MDRERPVIAFEPPIPDPVRIAYETGLHRIMRWEGIILKPDMPESDLEHVGEMFAMHDQNQLDRPEILYGMNDGDIRSMIYLHDAGEIVVGDLARDREYYSEVVTLWKRKESLGFHMLLRHIPDKDVRDYARNIYRRYHEKALIDRETHYVDLLDKLQALRFGRSHVFPGKRLKSVASQQQQFSNVFSLIMPPAMRLAVVSTPLVQEAVQSYIREELSQSGATGYRDEIVNFYQNEVTQAFSLLAGA